LRVHGKGRETGEEEREEVFEEVQLWELVLDVLAIVVVEAGCMTKTVQYR
jgi:hypothetical protein